MVGEEFLTIAEIDFCGVMELHETLDDKLVDYCLSSADQDLPKDWAKDSVEGLIQVKEKKNLSLRPAP